MKKVFGILAHPASHSLSPPMQSAAFAKCGINAEFLRFDIVSDELDDFIDRVRKEHISGLAVSLPHKEKIIPLLSGVTERAAAIGAVNTVFWKDNQLWGENTDAPGFLRAIESILSSHPRSAVIGAGGVARAIVYALSGVGLTTTVFNRTAEKAKYLAKEWNVFIGDLSEFSACDFDLVVNATSVGLCEEKSPVLKETWNGFSGTAFDVVFNPLKTRFLCDAKASGAKIITGEKMLLYQGILQFPLWTGFSAPEEVMEMALRKAL